MYHRNVLLCTVVFTAASVQAEEKPAVPKREAVARCLSQAGVLLRREAIDKPWQPVVEKEALQSGELLLGVDVGAALASNNGAVRLAFNNDLNKHSPFPILETTVVLAVPTDADLDVRLDRGRIDMVNTKEKGAARVRLRIRDLSGEIILKEPGSRLTVEIYGRWLRGVPFTKELKPGDGPAMAVVFLAVKGEVELKGKVRDWSLKAPPGPALLQADGLDAIDQKPVYLEALPPWAIDGNDTNGARRIRGILARFRMQVLAKGVSAALDELYQSDDAVERRLAVLLMGALDDLPRLGDALLHAKHADVWDAAVLALRHWIGRGPGQDQLLYRGLIEKRGYKPFEAETLLQLLHSFSDEEVARPELYEVLINYLGNEKLAVRGLAHWHLVRLAPAGKTIAYDPLAAKEKRDQSIAEWRKLVPSGKLPPESK